MSTICRYAFAIEGRGPTIEWEVAGDYTPPVPATHLDPPEGPCVEVDYRSIELHFEGIKVVDKKHLGDLMMDWILDQVEDYTNSHDPDLFD